MTKYVTFSVDCTYTVEIDVPDDASEDEITETAWKKVNATNIYAGDLENSDWELLSIDD